jgi:hypothetical protein
VGPDLARGSHSPPGEPTPSDAALERQANLQVFIAAHALQAPHRGRRRSPSRGNWLKLARVARYFPSVAIFQEVGPLRNASLMTVSDYCLGKQFPRTAPEFFL